MTTTATRAKEQDIEYEEVSIAKVTQDVDGWEIQRADGWSYYVPDKYGVEPRQGMLARFYGGGIGRPVRGLDLDGQTVFYRTDAQYRAQARREVAASDRKRRQAFERTGRRQLDAAYAALPEPFQRRLDRFRAGNPDFRWQHEGYEMAVCEAAVKLADTLKTADAVERFSKLDWQAQQEQAPGISDELSGNQHGCAVLLAHWYLKEPDLVVKLHGALAPLVGCADYGCTHEGAA